MAAISNILSSHVRDNIGSNPSLPAVITVMRGFGLGDWFPGGTSN